MITTGYVDHNLSGNISTLNDTLSVPCRCTRQMQTVNIRNLNAHSTDFNLASLFYSGIKDALNNNNQSQFQFYPDASVMQ